MERRVRGNSHARCGPGGKAGDDIKGLPIGIGCEISGYEAGYGELDVK